MPTRETLTASPAKLGDVLSNGKRYVVPMFQRDYAWEESEWSELWNDLLAVGNASEEAHHFLGALVLQPLASERGTFNIIDGQQRLVTLSILALAVIIRIEQLPAQGEERENNRERARILRERFVSTKDPTSLQHHSRLRLNASDDNFYQTHLVQGRAPARPTRLKGSEKRLYDCFEFFGKKIREHLKPEADGATLTRFLDVEVANRLRFIEIKVEDDETAFTVFETLNARGVALGTTDLLKNYLFAKAAQGGAADLEQARLCWERVVRSVEQEHVAALLFYKMSAQVPTLREKQVFVKVKQFVPTRDRTVFDFLYGLQDAAEIYAALNDPNDDFWQGFTSRTRHWVRVLSTLRVEQYRSVALAAFDKLKDRPEKIERLFRNLAVISVRATLAKVNTGDLQRAYQEAAYKVEHGELKSPHAIARALAQITPTDDEFRSAIATLEIDPKGPRKRLLKYLLAELEAASGGQQFEFDGADATVEHILPENPGPGWGAFSHEDHARYVIRLGNLTPLESRLNRLLGAATYERKQEFYAQSKYSMTRNIDSADWTPESVRARQNALAQLAVNIWQVPSDDQG